MLKAREIMQISKIIPVMRVNSVEESLRLAEALIEGGINIFEITLRTECAIDAISAIVKEFPKAITGAGTVLNTTQYKMVEDVGAHFAISPGLTKNLAQYDNTIPLIPGVATASEIMEGLEYGYDAFKLFPANVVGGTGALKAFIKPFENVVFCPTAGVNAQNVNEYLALKNVLCIGGSWMVDPKLVEEENFTEITMRTKEAISSLC